MILPPDRGQVVFQMKDFQLVSQLIEGAFPDYEQIIPRSKETRSVLSTSAFLKACKQAEIFAREGSHIARINITPGGELKPGSIMISGQSEETGSSQSEMDASIDGTPLLIAFNVRFLREVLEVVKTPEIALETTVDTAPGIIRPVGDENFLHVIMPMHLGS
jgi:DNA polymerase-3 subunit beta